MSKITLDFETSYDFDIADISYEVAKLNSSYQGIFLKMVTSFLNSRHKDDQYKLDRQAISIAKEIDSRTHGFLKVIVENYGK